VRRFHRNGEELGEGGRQKRAWQGKLQKLTVNDCSMWPVAGVDTSFTFYKTAPNDNRKRQQEKLRVAGTSSCDSKAGKGNAVMKKARKGDGIYDNGAGTKNNEN